MTDFAARRRMMVDTQVRPSDVTKFPIIDAMLTVPREIFVPDAQREAAYADEILPMGDGRVMLDPRTLAKMLDVLNIEGDELVLNVGCGFGYSTAIVARMAQAVISVEEDEAMASEAQDLLSDSGADNAVVHTGPLAEGADEHGPYDAVLIQGGVEDLPATIVDQLKDGGRICCIFMQGALGTVRVGFKSGDDISWRYAFNAAAPILPGFAATQEFAL